MVDYYYLLNSLPMLREGEPPPCSSKEFLRRCADWLTPAALAELTALQLLPPATAPAAAPFPIITAWHDWETDFRNRVALLRQAVMADHDPAAAQRPTGPCFPDNDRALQEAFAAAHPRERERLLDRARWRHLEELEPGWSFGFDRLCVYKLKLLLAEAEPIRDPATGRQVIANLVEELYRQESTTAQAGAA